jgi:hypothetical protein
MANVMIDIAAEFTGNKAFKQADTATDKLSKNVKKLATTFGLAFGTTAVLAYGKAAVKAAAADQKAQQQLALALKNVGLGRDAATSEAYIQRLQSEFGIVDDLLRPSYQTLAVATRDSAEAQRLMGIALDVSAANSLDLGAVTKALSRAYLGNNTALSRLGVGISKADLKTKSFKEITDQLSATFAGSATAAANSYQGSMDKLAVATENFKESIGVGLIEALNILNGEQGLAKTTSEIDKLGIKLQNATIGAAYFVNELKKIPGGSLLTSLLGNTFGDPLGIRTLINEFEKFKQQPRPFSTGMSISGQVQIRQQAQITKLTKEQAAAQSKITKDKKLQAALDKANLALLKGEEVFDMDKIQVAAALTNQAEQLGKATSSAQVLQIANDTARLNVKRSILALEDAIASKDEAAIIAATNKLNADLKILNALSGQNIKMQDIKSILDSLKAKDLINQANLDEALRKIKEMMALLAQANTQANAKVPTSASLGSGIPAGDYIAPIPMSVGLTASTSALIEASEAIQARADAFTMLLDLQTKADTEALAASSLGAVALNTFSVEDVARSSLLQGLAGGAGVAGAVSGSRYAAQAANAYNITIQANTIANPDELTNLIQNSIIQLNKRGDYLTTAGAL